MNIFYVSSSPEILPEHEPILKKIGKVTIIKNQKLDDDQAIEKLQDAEILIAAPSGLKSVSGRLLSSLPKLRFITTVTAGYDWIDIQTAKKLGILVSSCKGANAESVAEHTWAMILDLSKRVTEFDRDVRNKGAYDYARYQGKDVYEKTLGILGLGDIGTKVARIAKGFNMAVLGYNHSPKKIDGVRQVSLEELLAESDIISVHLPLTSETEKIINKEIIEKMKGRVILINTAREGIMNKADVLEALEKKKIYGLGIETEILKPIPGDDPYLQFPNVIINPHNAFNTEESDKRVKDTWVQNIVSFANGNPQNLVS